MLIDKFNRSIELMEVDAAAAGAPGGLTWEQIGRFVALMFALGLERVRIIHSPGLAQSGFRAFLDRMRQVRTGSVGIVLDEAHAGSTGDGPLEGMEIILALTSPDPGRAGDILDAAEGLAGRGARAAIQLSFRDADADRCRTVIVDAVARGIGVRLIQEPEPGLSLMRTSDEIASLCAGGLVLADDPDRGSGYYLAGAQKVPVKIAGLADRDCDRCNRLWLLPDGRLTLCDGLRSACDLKDLFEDDPDDAELVAFASKLVLNKPMSGAAICTTADEPHR